MENFIFCAVIGDDETSISENFHSLLQAFRKDIHVPQVANFKYGTKIKEVFRQKDKINRWLQCHFIWYDQKSLSVQ